MGNGPETSGDGYRYCGRGLIQLTGKDNYFWFASSLEISPEEASEYMETFEGAAQSACWFWETNNLNQWADSDDILTLTKRINGGTIGLEDRKKHYEHALEVFGVKKVATKTSTKKVEKVTHTLVHIQTALGLKADGISGPKTKAAISAFQKRKGLTPDGIAGPKTLNALFGD